jgi:N-acetylmuramoyl-L-alanine amidase
MVKFITTTLYCLSLPMLSCHRFILLLVLCWGCLCPEANAAKFSRVIIDAGHGAQDQGAKIGYIYEKHLALDLARRLERYLQGQGIKTSLTRQTDVFIPLEDRSAVANKTNDCIFVSVHFNMVDYPGPKGVETWYYNQEGASLAAYVQASIVSGLRTVNRGAKFARYKVLRTCARPAVLVEGGFISTDDDLKRCLDPKYRESLAQSIGEGLLKYRKS